MERALLILTFALYFAFVISEQFRYPLFNKSSLSEQEILALQMKIASKYDTKHELLHERAECSNVIVHTMGKTGSAGFVCSLNNGVPVDTSENTLPANANLNQHKVYHIHDPEVVADTIARIHQSATVLGQRPQCVAILLARNPYQRWISQYWQNILEYHPNWNKSFVQSVNVKVLQDAFVSRLRSGYASHSEHWLAGAFEALHGDAWSTRLTQHKLGKDALVRNGVPLAWRPLNDFETYRYVPAGDGLPCATLMLRFENSKEWAEAVRKQTKCQLAQQCLQFGKPINPQLSSEKWYAAKKEEFIKSFSYPDDLAATFRGGPLRRFFGYSPQPPSDLSIPTV